MDIETTQSTTKIKLQYGLRGEQIVHISEIADDERGLKCGCICPGCGMTLQARIGKIKQPHFSHNNAKCDLKSAQQSALHILAKDIIEKEKRIKCPDVVFDTSDLDLDNGYFIYGGYDKKIFKKRGLLNCETVVLEKRVSDIIPDIVVTSGNRTFFIEIAVTHFIDETKLEKIRKLKIPTLEINLSGIIDSPISKEELKEIIVNSFNNKSWVYRPNEEQYKAEYFQYIKDEFTKRENIENEYIRKEENRQKAKAARKEKAKVETEKLKNPEHYQKVAMSLVNDEDFFNKFKNMKFYVKTKGRVPFYINIPVFGEMIFNCDRRIWQGALFEKFIYYRSTKKENTLNWKRIEKWIFEHQKEFKINYDYSCSVEVQRNGIPHRSTLAKEAVLQYLEYLDFLGFISAPAYNIEEGEWLVLSTYNIYPPNKEEARKLKKAIKECDEFSINVYNLIFDGLYEAE